MWPDGGSWTISRGRGGENTVLPSKSGAKLDICRGLGDEQLDRPIDIGPKTVRITLRHIIYNIEAWSDLMAGRPMRKNPPLEEASITALSERLDAAAVEFTRIARDVADR